MSVVRLRTLLFCALFVSAMFSVPASAQVGHPTGGGAGNTFAVRLTQGAATVVDNPAVPFPADIQIPPDDADPEDYVVVGYLDGPAQQRPITLKVVSYGPASTSFRLTSWYLQAPLQTGGMIDINTPGPQSLLDPNNPGPIDVRISKIRFTGTPAVRPLLLSQSSFFVSYMRDGNGNFYQFPEANAYNSFGHGVADIQVSGIHYLNANLATYAFLGVCGSKKAACKWDNVVNPGLGTPIHNGGGLAPSFPPGFVFELGLAVAFVPRAPVSVADFVSVLLGQSSPAEPCLYDYNLDGLINGLDVQGFVDDRLN